MTADRRDNAVHLPINDILSSLKEQLAVQSNVVLMADPGAGKTTRVPLALLHETWLAGQRIVMLEPRRLAARSAAHYMAGLLGERVGDTVGYRVRLDSKVGAHTRIEVITEGILTRMLQHDPALEGIGLVIFDEFHERSLHSDLGLALCLQSQQLLRSDLRILVMSATLDATAVSEMLQAPVLNSAGRQYPVETCYWPLPQAGRIESAVAHAVQAAFQSRQGDILVFLPGAGEIHRVASLLAQEQFLCVDIVPLYGNLSLAAQDKALLPSPPGSRKVVLATSIAETSLTVEGITTVIDSGLTRVPRFSPRTGMTRLETVSVSLAAADQRRGRAGRLGPGVCYRLWSERDELEREKFTKPEIMTVDLATLALELAVWGVRDPADLNWLDAPPPAAWAQACDLLTKLGAITSAGKITDHGRVIAEMALHPRLAHMVLIADKLGYGIVAAELAVLLSERDILPGSSEPDLRLRLDALRQGTKTVGSIVNQRMKREVQRLRQFLMNKNNTSDERDCCGLVLALAYPDRIGQNRGSSRFLLSSGRGALLTGQSVLNTASYLVAAELDDKGSDSRIFLAAPVDLAELRAVFCDDIENRRAVFIDTETRTVRGRQREWLGALLLSKRPIVPTTEESCSALVAEISRAGLDVLPWTKQTNQWRQRVACLHHAAPEQWPDMSNESLLASLSDWLEPFISGMTSAQDIQRISLQTALESLLDWRQLSELSQDAPTHITVPSGQRIPIDYSNPAAPVLAVRLQEVFGLTETPRINSGRIVLTLHLLSPARRPVQVTQDLANFWRTTYFAVRKEFLGRYPKHYWPEDPLTAQATNRAKGRG